MEGSWNPCKLNHLPMAALKQLSVLELPIASGAASGAKKYEELPLSKEVAI